MNFITAQKLEQFQQATGERLSVAISYLEAEEGLVFDAVNAYRADKGVVMRIQINIEFGNWPLADAIRLVQSHFLHQVNVQVQNSTYIDDGEEAVRAQVLVCELTDPHAAVMSTTYLLCTRFGQDCAAVRWGNGEGMLVGPRAEGWGGFNPEYFLGYKHVVA